MNRITTFFLILSFIPLYINPFHPSYPFFADSLLQNLI